MDRFIIALGLFLILEGINWRRKTRPTGPCYNSAIGAHAISINIRFGQREDVAQQFEARLRVICNDNLDDIETKKNVWIVEEPQPGQGPASDSFLLVAIHGIKRTAEIFAGPGFHFDKNERVFVAADDVDLAPAATAKITIEDFVAAPAQKPASQFLPPTPKPKMLGTRRRKPAAPPVRKIGDESDKVRAHAILSGAVPCRSLCAG